MPLPFFKSEHLKSLMDYLGMTKPAVEDTAMKLLYDVVGDLQQGKVVGTKDPNGNFDEYRFSFIDAIDAKKKEERIEMSWDALTDNEREMYITQAHWLIEKGYVHYGAGVASELALAQKIFISEKATQKDVF